MPDEGDIKVENGDIKVYWTGGWTDIQFAEYWRDVALRVSHLHHPNGDKTACRECWGTWPCKTQRILHGEE